ncbi:hypothetical protein PHLGIDRAFT_123131 [Phlebiopsis gigantea 11061_1 CR5-6]|uniref:Uncharacterized protein n=1 Tax=Phlebiopsis gigantea (strain 11061_1 CR5-6) TaxID=745531 RepID=A0A0C3NB12_PHLG1|nr:hypothetical protein PHLGIDRAFT_123131 [Phlebiopsis gigantea 11061_1 CR5-6]
MAATTSLVDKDGQLADWLKKLAKVFQDQFMPGNPKAVDQIIVNDMPQLEEWSFPSILWWHPSWKGKKWIQAALQKA